MDPGNPEVIGGLVRAVVAEGNVDEARVLLDAIDAEAAKHPAIARARAALDLASAPVTDVSAEEARLAADPDDHEARFAIANARMAAGDRDTAAEEMLTIIGRDAAWNEGAAKARLLQMLEAAGFEDPWGRGIRRRLSALLFT
jgi:putative thioredoxin